MMQEHTPDPVERLYATCPYCSLLCDDLTLTRDPAQAITAVDPPCPRAVPGFTSTNHNQEVRMAGQSVPRARAVAEAARLLREAKQPLIGGLATDVQGMREALALADRLGAIVDHMHGEALTRNIRVLQESGWILTTLTEARNRADLVILVGCDPERGFPRFFDRVVWVKEAMITREIDRRCVTIGPDRPRLAVSPEGAPPLALQCPREDLGEVMTALRCAVEGRQIDAGEVHGIPWEAILDLAHQLKKAKYPVFVWSPGELDFPHGDLVIRAICDLIRDLNVFNRAAGLILGGNEGGLTAQSVSAWQTGYPLRVGFGRGYPWYRPHAYASTRLLADGMVDVLVWIAAFGTCRPPPKSSIPTIVLADPAIPLDPEPEIFLPIGTPGRDHPGSLYRTDNVVAAPVRQQRKNLVLPSTAEVLKEIKAAL